jgi:hypothetical protein
VRIGVTGHRDLTPETACLVAGAFDRHLAERPDVVGLSCLAEGADVLFAWAVLRRGGALEAIVPSAEHRGRRDDVAEYDRLLERAATVTRLPYPEDGPAALMAASLVLVERSDLLLAVWDGRPARGLGGTADVVEYARRAGVPVTVIWPPGAARIS